MKVILEYNPPYHYVPEEQASRHVLPGRKRPWWAYLVLILLVLALVIDLVLLVTYYHGDDKVVFIIISVAVFIALSVSIWKATKPGKPTVIVSGSLTRPVIPLTDDDLNDPEITARKILGTVGLVHLFVPRKDIALIAGISRDTSDSLVEFIRAIKRWERDANFILYSSTPSYEISDFTLTNLCAEADLVVFCDISDLSEAEEKDAERVISRFIDVALDDLDGVSSHSIGTISYNGIRLRDINIKGDDLRLKLEEELVLQESIAAWALANGESPQIFYKTLPESELRAEIEDFFVHEKKFPLEYTGMAQAPATIEITRFYHHQVSGNGNITKIL